MAYKTKQGRRIPVPVGAVNGKQHCVKLEGTVATFQCVRGGHLMRHDFSKGPRPKQITKEAMLKKMALYWGLGMPLNGARGHCNGWCQKCQNEIDGVTAQASTGGGET